MGKTTINAPAGEPYIDMEREFDAPRELVHRAYLDPELVTQWLGPRKYEMVIDTWDARDGGAYRYVHRDGESEHGFRGVFHSMDIDNMVQTFEYEGAPGHVSLDRQALEDLGNGRSRVKSTRSSCPLPTATRWSRPAWATASRTATTASTSSWSRLQPVGASR